MRFLIEIGLEDLKDLPEQLRQKIQSSLNLAPAPPQQMFQQPAAPVQQMPAFMPPQFQQPAFYQPEPAKQGVLVGDKVTFPADRSHMSQQNMALDINTNQPVAIGAAPAAPFIPQVPQVQPVNVQPVMQVQHAPPMQVGPVDLTKVKSTMLRTYQRTDIDGPATVKAVLQQVGLTSPSAVTDSNAAAVAAALQGFGVSL